MSVTKVDGAYMLLMLSFPLPPAAEAEAETRASARASTPELLPAAEVRVPAPPTFAKTTATRHRQRRKGEKYSDRICGILKGWIREHRKQPFPNPKEKLALMQQTELTSVQICNWMSNERRRVLKCTSKSKRKRK